MARGGRCGLHAAGLLAAGWVEAEESAGRRRTRGSEFHGRGFPERRHRLHDPGQERRLIPPAHRWRFGGRRQQERGIGLDHQPFGRDHGHALAQRGATALISHPAGDAEVQIQLDTGLDHRLIAGKAVKDGIRERIAMLAEDGEEVSRRVALVEKDRMTVIRSQSQLSGKSRALIGARREIAVIIKPGLTHGDGRWPFDQSRECRRGVR